MDRRRGPRPRRTAVTVGGSALALLVDREALAASAASGDLSVVVFQRELTRAESVEFGHEVLAVAAMLFTLFFTAAYRAGLGALGDFVGDRLLD